MSTTSNTKPKTIRAVIGLSKMADGKITPLLDGSLKGLTDHANIFSKPTVDLATYEAAINAYEAAIPAALDGSKAAVAQKNKLRDVAVKLYSQNARYVEANCNDDMATFLLSGFQAASVIKTPPQPLPLPVIASVVQGPVSGKLKLTIKHLPKAINFVLRHGSAPPAGGPPVTWVEETLPSKKPVIVESLTPGTVYTFQVKALGYLGYTDWSDPVSRMVI